MKKILRNTILLLVALAFLWKDFVSVGYQVDYFLNQQSYLEACVNKAKPNLHCNGKCQLALKLKHIETEAKSNLDKHTHKQPFKFRELEAYTLLSYFPDNAFAINIPASEETVPLYLEIHSVFSPKSVFHPPCV